VVAVTHRWVDAYEAGRTVESIAAADDVPVSRVRLLLATAGVTSKRPRNPAGGRPRRWTEDDVQRWRKRIAEGATLREIAADDGCRPGTISNWVRRD
jgi:hypothetical protein